MQAYDIFMLVVLVAAVVWGFWKGFAWQLASLASIALSYFVALNFRAPVANIVGGITKTGPPWNVFLAMLVLFLGTALFVWITFNFISDFIERVRLKEFDRQVGAIFGLVLGVLLCVIITLFSVTLLGQERCQAICNSRSGYYIAWLLYQAETVMPAEVQHVLSPYVNPNGAPPPGYTNMELPAGYQELPRTYGEAPNAVPNYSQPVYPDYAQPGPQNSYQPNGQYDPRYGSQPQYPNDAPPGFQR